MNLEWQPIETAPKDGTNIWGGVEDFFTIVYWSNDEWFDHTGNKVAMELTHWMPLPPPTPKI